MKRCFGTSFAVIGLLAETLSGASNSIFTGTWEGKVNNLPAVEIVFAEAHGKLAGIVVFPFHQRGPDGKWAVRSRHSTPMRNPRIEGQTLIFETLHSKSHGSPELGPNVKFRMKMINDVEARFYKVEPSTSPSPGLKMTKRR